MRQPDKRPRRDIRKDLTLSRQCRAKSLAGLESPDGEVGDVLGGGVWAKVAAGGLHDCGGIVEGGSKVHKDAFGVSLHFGADGGGDPALDLSEDGSDVGFCGDIGGGFSEFGADVLGVDLT